MRCVGAGSASPAGMMCPAGRCGAYRRRGVDTPPYGCVARSAVNRGVGDAAPYAPFIDRIS